VPPLYAFPIKRELLIKNTKNLNHRGGIMTKGQDSKKGTKKEPAKTLKEKRAAKKAKKDEKKQQGFSRD
jgi:hypothetical protein